MNSVSLQVMDYKQLFLFSIMKILISFSGILFGILEQTVVLTDIFPKDRFYAPHDCTEIRIFKTKADE